MLPHVSWGLVAPITANLTNPEDRGRVCGTVKSYCGRHSSNLVSVIYLHRNFLVKGPKTLLPTSLRPRSYPGNQKDTDSLRKSILADIMDPYLSLTDFFPQLSTSSGNIIIISEEDMYDGEFIPISVFGTRIQLDLQYLCDIDRQQLAVCMTSYLHLG